MLTARSERPGGAADARANHRSQRRDTTEQRPGSVVAVIPNYNGGELVLRCIESVLQQTHAPIELVVVDNASSDGSPEAIRQRFPGVRLIDMGYNSGWGRACNTGMAAADSEYILLLNNDAFMEPDCVAEMVRALGRDPRYGSCASRILLWDQPQTAEVCGLVIYRDGTSIGRGRLGPADRYMSEEEVFCANDCCCLYRRTMIEDIGDYDPDFFMYCDETEMGWRHQIAGWKCIYTPRAVAYHAHSRAAGSYSPFKAYHVERNRIYLCLKCFPVPDLLLSFAFSAYRYLYQWYLSSTTGRGALAHYRAQHSLAAGLWILLRAHGAALRKAPVMWRRRRQLMRRRRVNLRDIHGLFARHGLAAREVAGYE